MKENKNKVGRPSELADCLEKAKEYLLGGYKTFGDVVPSIAGLACYLGKHRDSMYEYAKKSDDFSDTLKSIKTIQENSLINGGLKGDFNPTIAKLMLANHGYSDKQEVTGADGAPLMSPTTIKLVSGTNDNSNDSTAAEAD